jgi:CMP-N,N'-diacetyllegionaminic acid synthase
MTVLRRPSIVALIPARAGSKRVKGKNVRQLGGHPMIAYTIAAAKESGVFAAVIVSTDSEEVAAVARHYGAEVPFLRPAAMAGDTSADIEWVEYTLNTLKSAGRSFDCFSILRPTSPFRQAATIRRAWDTFRKIPDADSLRAVELCEQHPGKMWVLEGHFMTPLLKDGPKSPPWHSTPYQALPRVYAQNASLEMAWSLVALEDHSIAGEKIVPFVTEGHEGFDINNACDWLLAEHFVRSGEAVLPTVPQKSYKIETEETVP